MINSRVSKIHWSFFLVVTLSTMSLRGQSVEDLFTRAEATDFAETTSYEEVIELSNSLAELSDNIHLTTFGYTNEFLGRGKVSGRINQCRCYTECAVFH